MSTDVFKINRIFSSEQEFRYIAEINETHPVFKGHFPGVPVVPGVCTMNMLKKCIADVMERDVRYNYIKECKFLSAITLPGHKLLDVTINIKHTDSEISVSAEIMSQGTKMMKLKATVV